jgi:post-segregation antitoxin (ccd killing protein)
MDKDKNRRVRITVLLDDKTLAYLRDYHYNISGTTNVSKAIMSMVKEHESKNISKENT